MALKLEEAKRLVALKLLTSSTGSFSDRAKRIFETTREEIGDHLKKTHRELKDSKDSDLVVRLGWSDEAVTGARKISLAIDEFKQKYPESGEKLQEIIDIHRSQRRAYLEFGGHVPDEVYIGIVREILGDNVDYRQANEIYLTIFHIGKILKKDGEPQRSLLSE